MVDERRLMYEHAAHFRHVSRHSDALPCRLPNRLARTSLVGCVMPDGTARATVRERVQEALREIGVLLIALSPLDAVVASSRAALFPLLLLAIGGLILFIVAVSMEANRDHV